MDYVTHRIVSRYNGQGRDYAKIVYTPCQQLKKYAYI